MEVLNNEKNTNGYLRKKAQEIGRRLLKDYIFSDEIFNQLALDVVIDGDDSFLSCIFPNR